MHSPDPRRHVLRRAQFVLPANFGSDFTWFAEMNQKAVWTETTTGITIRLFFILAT